MEVVEGIDALAPELGPAFVVVGVFDGMHLGHAYLLDHLVSEAAARHASPTVITFDHHPDEVLRGTAPALLLDPQERLERLEAAGLAVTVVQHFDDALRRTPYDAFVERIRSRLTLTGFLMTPDAAFGFERRGTPVTLAALGARDGFEVVVVPPFTIDGHEVRSSEIRDGDRRGRLRRRGTAARTAGHDHGRDRRSGRRRCPARLPPARRPATRWRVRRAGGRRVARLADQGRRRLPVRAGPRRSRLGRARSVLTRRRSAAAEDLGCRVRIRRIAASLADAVVRLPGRFAGPVVSLATRLTTLMPGEVGFRDGLGVVGRR